MIKLFCIDDNTKDWQLMPHFKAEEFSCHCGGKHPSWIALELVHKLETLRMKLRRPIRVTSGYRCPGHNNSVGGAAKSQHVQGRAADIQVDGLTVRELAAAARAVGFGFVLEEPTWVHVDVRGA